MRSCWNRMGRIRSGKYGHSNAQKEGVKSKQRWRLRWCAYKSGMLENTSSCQKQWGRLGKDAPRVSRRNQLWWHLDSGLLTSRTVREHVSHVLTTLCTCVQLLSHVRLSVTPWTVAHQAPLSMVSLQAGILDWVPFSSSRNLPNPGIKPKSPVSPALAGRFLTTEPPEKPTQFMARREEEPDVWGSLATLPPHLTHATLSPSPALASAVPQPQTRPQGQHHL